MDRPWGKIGRRPWEAQQPLYPRAVSISRQQSQLQAGDAGYLASTAGNCSPVAGATDLPASIQQTREPGAPEGHTPSDAPNRSVWNIFIPGEAAALGLITERDQVTDDLGKNYIVI